MHSTFRRTDRQPQATAGNHSQRSLSVHAEAPPSRPLQLLPAGVLVGASFSAVLQFAAQHSGRDDADIADALHICRGYMSRFMRGVAQQWAKRIVIFMRETSSLGPLQWMAQEVGCEVVVRSAVEAEKAALVARLRELERSA